MKHHTPIYKNDSEMDNLSTVHLNIERRMPRMMMASPDYFDCAMHGNKLNVLITDNRLETIINEFRELVLKLHFLDKYEGYYFVRDVVYDNSGHMMVVLSFE